jgi:transposase
MSRQQKPSRQVSVDEQIQVVLAVLKGELSLAGAARRRGVSSATVGNWRDRFADAGRAGMDRSLPGPDGGESQTGRRLRHECEQLKLALAEATVQLRIWQKGSEFDGNALAVEVNLFRHTYNTLRPHQAPGERTPRAAYLGAGHCDERVAFGGPAT